MARFTVVVAPDAPNAYEEITEALSGEDVRVIVDRRRPREAEAAGPQDPIFCERRGRTERLAGASRAPSRAGQL